MNKRIPIFIGLIFLVLALWLQTTSIDVVHQFILRLNNVAYDMQLRTKLFNHKQKLNSSVAIIDIDDKSLQAIGRWPWPRSQIAKLITRLHEEGVVVIAMDIMFAEKESDIASTVLEELDKRKLNTPSFTSVLKQIEPDFSSDLQLATAIKQQDSVLGMTFLPREETSGELPPPLITLNHAEKDLGFIDAAGYISNIAVLQQAAKFAGFINVYPDSDGIIRRVPILIRYQDKLYPSLALAAVKLFLLANVTLSAGTYNDTLQLEAIKVGDHTIPVDANGQMLISFVGRSFTFPYYSAIDVINKKLPLNALAGKIVFLGTSATGLGDLRATAISGVFPGVEIQASLADGILQDRYSYKPEWTRGLEIFVLVLVGLFATFIFPYLGPRTLTLCVIIIPVCMIALNNWLWARTGLIIFILIPILLVVALAIINMTYGYLFETRKREHLKEMFGQYVPEEHIDEMLKAPDEFALTGEDREMTVLFADIRNFTGISETLTASELKSLLNDFFTPMTEIIFKYQGTIDKYIGDLIMAFWGAPLKDEKHAEHAMDAALEMLAEQIKLREKFTALGLPELNIGIGLNTGEMSVGDMGSRFRRNYTVLGDAVNLGSRVEGLTKFYGVNVIVTGNTQKDQPRFVFRQLDRVRVKGKKLGVDIFEIVARTEEIAPVLLEEIQQSNIAIEYYFQQEWQRAEDLFQALYKAHPDVKIYPMYLERITSFKEHSPPPDWDGVYAHATK
jgi:adenylate cyclase